MGILIELVDCTEEYDHIVAMKLGEQYWFLVKSKEMKLIWMTKFVRKNRQTRMNLGGGQRGNYSGEGVEDFNGERLGGYGDTDYID